MAARSPYVLQESGFGQLTHSAASLAAELPALIVRVRFGRSGVVRYMRSCSSGGSRSDLTYAVWQPSILKLRTCPRQNRHLDRGELTTLLRAKENESHLQYGPVIGCSESSVQSASTSIEPLAVPELALPIVGKTTSLMPADQVAHLTGTCAKRVTRVLTVGWRAAEHDFMDSLRNSVLASDFSSSFQTDPTAPLRRVECSASLQRRTGQQGTSESHRSPATDSDWRPGSVQEFAVTVRAAWTATSARSAVPVAIATWRFTMAEAARERST